MIGELPLFPLQAVLFPGGLLSLKVFEARYLDLVGRCLRESAPFGVVCLRQGSEVHQPGGDRSTRFEHFGVMARLDEVDAEQQGILRVRCCGTQRFRLFTPHQQDDGLWLANAETLPDEIAVLPSEALLPTVRALATAIARLKQQGTAPFLQPYRFEDAGWVANRWCEILPIPLAAKQKLLELDEPLMRLQLVDEFLRGKGVVG
jgi:Lon protease-like protein